MRPLFRVRFGERRLAEKLDLDEAWRGDVGRFACDHVGGGNARADKRLLAVSRRRAAHTTLEVPSSLIGQGVVHAWATASLYGHAPEVQVSRWGLPMITHILLSDPSLHDASETYNRAVPADEVALFSKPIRDFVEKVTALAHSAADPSAYATQLLARLCPSVLPYELDTPASFSFAAFNGRGLCDDVMDVILTLVTNTALGDGVAPDMRLMRPDFPYFGEPHVTAASSAKQ